MGGTKFDSEKPRLALIPPNAELAMGQAFTHGANKYGTWNWMGGIEVVRNISAARRHLNAFMRREDLDPESGYSHLGHAMAAIAMAYETSLIRPDLDDRPNYEE